jgi:hypothetical protein
MPNDKTDLALLDLLIEDLEQAHQQMESAEPALGQVLDALLACQKKPGDNDVLETELETVTKLGLVRDRVTRIQAALAHAGDLQRRFNTKRRALDDQRYIEAGGVPPSSGGGSAGGGGFGNRPRLGRDRG